MRLTQRQINLGVFGVLTIGGTLLFISSLAIGETPSATLAVLIGTVLCGGLWIAYWRGWEYARQAAVILLTLIVGLGPQEPSITRQFDIVIFIPPIVALILTQTSWMVGSAMTILGILLWRAGGQGVYTDPTNLVVFAAIIAGLMFSRLATDNAERLAEANARAELALARAEQQGQELAQQAQELATRNEQQQRLLDLVATLETPAVQMAEGVLFVPIVGHLDSRRAESLTTRLLQDVYQSQAQLVILDIAGVSVVDTGVAKAILQTAQALRLLGCTVFLSGISAHVATTLVGLGIEMEELITVRNPQDALARYAEMSKHAGNSAPGRL